MMYLKGFKMKSEDKNQVISNEYETIFYNRNIIVVDNQTSELLEVF